MADYIVETSFFLLYKNAQPIFSHCLTLNQIKAVFSVLGRVGFLTLLYFYLVNYQLRDLIFDILQV